MNASMARAGLQWLATGAVLVMLGGAGCQTTGPTVIGNELPFDQAVAQATDGLVAQTQKLPAFLAKVEVTVGAKVARKALVIDPMIDAASAQQTRVTRQLEQKVSERLAQHPQIEVLPFRSANLARAQYLLTGTMVRSSASGAAPSQARRPFQINLALVDLQTRTVLAQASALARDDGLDTSPTAYYQDSPVLVRDGVVDGYIRTSQSAPGQPADAYYLDRLAASALVSDGNSAYDASQYQDALGLYRNALSTPAGDQLRALNGVYLASWKLGRTAEAEQAFGRVVAFGLQQRNLGVKFLFNPGSTEFWSDPRVSGPYALWLRQIARQTAAAKVCMTVVGHTSRTGSEQTNDRLSQARASVIKQKLDADAAELATRTKASGVGWRENIIGTGTDDVTDALDRRVEFKITDCA